MQPDAKKKALRRLKIIAGQIRGLERMVEEEKYCIDIITQVEAVRESLRGVKDVILKNHLATHLAHQMKHGQEEKAVVEMLKVYAIAGKNK